MNRTGLSSFAIANNSFPKGSADEKKVLEDEASRTDIFNRNKLRTYGFDSRDEFLGRFRDFSCRFSAARQGSTGSDSDAAKL